MNDYMLQFEDWMQQEDKGEKTIKQYVSVIERFMKWFEQTEDVVFKPESITTLHIQDYRSYLQNTLEQKPASINKALATIKTFFSWATDAGYVRVNPSTKVRMKRVQESHSPKWLTQQELNRLFHALDSERNEFKQARDRAVVMVMLKAGLRCEEASEMKIQHVDLRQERITVVSGKGGKFRVVPINTELKKLLKQWLAFRETSDKPVHQESEYLFVTERSGQMTTRAIPHMVDEYLERCGLLVRDVEGKKLEGQISVHSLRHTFCKSLVNDGVAIQEVARLAGHDNIQTTMRYVEPSEQDLKKAVQMI